MHRGWFGEQLLAEVEVNSGGYLPSRFGDSLTEPNKRKLNSNSQMVAVFSNKTGLAAHFSFLRMPPGGGYHLIFRD